MAGVSLEEDVGAAKALYNDQVARGTQRDSNTLSMKTEGHDQIRQKAATKSMRAARYEMTAVSRLHDLFAVFDTGGSGTLDAEGVLAILTRGEAGLSLQDAQEIVRDFDDNHDGVLSADEFAKAWASLGDGLDADALPVAGDLIEVVSGDYTGRVGEVRRYDPDWDKHRTDAEAGGDGQGDASPAGRGAAAPWPFQRVVQRRARWRRGAQPRQPARD